MEHSTNSEKEEIVFNKIKNGNLEQGLKSEKSKSNKKIYVFDKATRDFFGER
ncbi:hypothetical protein [Bacillus sp. OAE603]|uniref:hypothetical protein n=1 Tax=Gottfriedia sp. OAE603 TaxID=2663872 RepID=UPI00178C06A9